jgi:hypothetical protein
MYYAAIERFDRDNGERWMGYARWLGRTDLQRVVTLDSHLCRPLIHVESGADWEFVAQEEFMLDFFTDLDFVLRRAAGIPRALVVAATRDPSEADVGGFSRPDFEFEGFDVVDAQFTSSALFNGNRFPGVFDVSELSAGSGLILSRDRAFAIRDSLRQRYPGRDQAQCYVWAIWRYTGSAGHENSSVKAG